MADVVHVVFDAPIVEAGMPVLLVAAAQPGLQGPPGPPDVNSLKTYNRLSEFDTPEAKAAARANLELQHIDCGEF